MTVPSVSDLITGKFLQSPKTARGIYLDRNPGKNDLHVRFVWAAPDKWVWMHMGEPPTGAITDGTTNVIVEDGVAVLVTEEGEVATSHGLMNLLNPMVMGWDEWRGDFSAVQSGDAISRPAWLVSATPRQTGKAQVLVDLAFDQESGVLLYMKDAGTYWGFEELELDEEISDETFRWDGPTEPRKMGMATIARDEDGAYRVWWEVRHGIFHLHGGRQPTKDEAVAWGEERAERIYFRPD